MSIPSPGTLYPGEFQHLRTVPLFAVEPFLPVRRPSRHLRIEVSPTISVGPTDIVNGDYVRHTNPKFLDDSVITLRGGTPATP